MAQAPASVSVHAVYETYAAGLQVADVDAGFSIGPWTYQMNLAYRTTGMVGFFYRGHQDSSVSGSWHDSKPVPTQFSGEGVWRGKARVTDIVYAQGKPMIRALQPPNEEEREPVPEALRDNSVDTLSALADLMRSVAATGKCDLAVRTYDGRRLVEIDAHTVGEETLEPTKRSVFAGKALRCDFAGRLLAGFLFTDDRAHESKPLHGSAWIAQVVPGAPPLPVRMSFETRWFGDATMYLTAAGPRADVAVAGK